jgi:hypothetical protein
MTKHLAIFSCLFALLACVFVSGDLVIRPGATLLLHSSIAMNGGDLAIEPGGTLDLEGGTVAGIGTVLLPAGSNLDGPGGLEVLNDWVNNSTFVRPVDPAAEITIAIAVSVFENHAPGSGDTDGDGFTDHGEGTLDQDLDMVPDFLDPDALRMDRPPNSWLLANGLPTNLVATADSDGDGLSNLEEYHALTDPQDAGSVLRVTAFTPLSPETFRIDWSTVAGKAYRVYGTTNGVPDASYGILFTNITATGNAHAITSAVPAGAARAFVEAVAIP